MNPTPHSVNIFFKSNGINELATVLNRRSYYLICSKGAIRRGINERLKASAYPPHTIYANVSPNPTLSDIEAFVATPPPQGIDLVVAVGGGSVIDFAKAATAGWAHNKGWLTRHFYENASFESSFNPLPIIAIPTTAGTGSEVTPWATVWDLEQKRKLSISHSRLYPSDAVIDPALTLTTPKDITLFAGLDALSHAMESIWNRNHQQESDRYAIEAIKLIISTLPKLINDLSNLTLRERMSKAALLAGQSINLTRTALAHSISYPITLQTGMPHGLACSFTLPEILRFNYKNHPERCQLMIEALDEQNIDRATNSLHLFFKTLGVANYLAKYSFSQIDSKYGTLIDTSRASNNLEVADEKDAKQILTRSIITLGIA